MSGGDSFKGGGADAAVGGDGGKNGGVSLASFRGEKVGLGSSPGGDLGRTGA